MKKLLMLSLFSLAILTASAQRITVTKGEVDCGKILFRHPVTAQFELRNRGLRHLKINNVESSCGCTTVDYPQNEISANVRFTITAVYDAETLGHFEKEVAVYSNGSKEPVYLKMKGVVVAELKDYSGTYPIDMGAIRVDKNDIEFDNVNRGDKPIQQLQVLNLGHRNYVPTVMHLPAYLKAEAVPAEIAPGHNGTVVISLDSKLLRDYGLTQTSVYIARYPGDKVCDSTAINVSSVLLPDFKSMTNAQRAFAPKIKLSAENIDLGKFGTKEKLNGTIDITNIGKSQLDISSLQMFSSGLEVTLGKRSIKPGETTKLKVTAHKQQIMSDKRSPRVLMITNDPAMGKVVIKINVK